LPTNLTNLKQLLSGIYPLKSRKNFLLLPVLLAGILFANIRANAQNPGDFRTALDGGIGNWEDASTWERFAVGPTAGWVPATYAPTSADGEILIQNSDQVNVNASRTVDQVVISSSGILIVFGGTLTINNGTGNDVDVVSGGQFSFNGGSPNLTVNPGAVIAGPTNTPGQYVSFGGNQLTNWGTIYSVLISNGNIYGRGSIGTLITFKTSGAFTNLFNGDQTITDFLNFNYGGISTGPNRLIIAETATVQNNSLTEWFVQGTLEMLYPMGTSTKTFRIGDFAGNYTPLTATLTKTFGFPGQGLSASIVSSSTFPHMNTSGIDSTKDVNRWWVVSADSMSFNNATITLNWPAAAVDPGVTTANLRVGRWGGSWSYPNSFNPTSTSIVMNGISNSSSGNYVVGEMYPIVNIPDGNFKLQLVSNPSINTNGDTEIQVSEAAAYTGAILVDNKNIASLTGIEAFTQITSLNCSTNQLTSLDVTNNTLLQSLNCAGNSLTSLNVSNNSALTTLWCFLNPISTLDLADNILLTDLSISNTNITSINLANNTAMTRLVLENNQFTSLDVSTLTALQNLYITNNLFTSIDVSTNTSLQGLFCGVNQLTGLDLSQNTALTKLVCPQNLLTTLNIQNGNNTNLTQFDATGNSALNCIQVDDPAYMNANWAAGKDINANYSLDCGAPGLPGEALHFDGIDDVVKGPVEMIPIFGPYTVSAWAKQDFFQSGVLKNIVTQGRKFYIGSSYTDSIRVGDSWLNTGVPWPTDTLWHNYTVVRTDTNTYLYLDGILRATAGYGIPHPGSSPPTNPVATFYIGSQWTGNSEHFNGKIDEVRIWNQALSAAEIQKSLNCEITDGRTGLMAVYNFNQGIAGDNNLADTVLLDASGHGRNSELQNFTLNDSNISNWVAPGAVVTGSECCNLELTTSVGDTLYICTEDKPEPYVGSVNLIITNGTPPYTITGSDTTNIGPGIYNYYVTDAAGCTDTTTLTVVVSNCIVPFYQPPANDTTNNLIGSELTQLFNFPNSVVDTTSKSTVFLTKDNFSQVLIEVIADAAQYNSLLALLQTPEYGLNNIIDNGDTTLTITGFIPIANLTKLNDLVGSINYVRPYFPPILNGETGLTTTQGDVSMVSDKSRKAWKLSGNGVKIGVMSDSYNTKFGDPAALDVANGDLPGLANPNNMQEVNVTEEYPAEYGKGTDEGRAMLQIVHDVAPEATLYFKSGFISAGNFADGIKELRDLGCDVIVDDITYITEPFFRDGVIAQAVNNVTASGVSYFTSAGNFGKKSYEAVFNPAAATPSDYLGTAHQFENGTIYQSVSLLAGNYTIAMQWDDDFYSLGNSTGAQNDFDIYLVDEFNNLLFGLNRNNLGGDPFELLPFVVKAPVNAKIVIARKAGAGAVRFKYIFFRGDGIIKGADNVTENIQGTGTVIGQANAATSIAVGAALYLNTPAYGINPPTIASFSSRGGVLVNNVNRNKPDIIAPNGVNTTVDFGGVNIDDDPFPNFFGTSAAAPHAAAVAGLLIEAKKRFFNDTSFTAAQMKTILTTTTVNMDVPGFDETTGWGFVRADSALLSFSNPSPLITSYRLADSSFVPGDDPVTLVINGEYFSNAASVILRSDTIPAIVLNSRELNVNIPTFPGNPPLTVYNPPITPLGLDGGVSDSIYLKSAIPQNVKVIVNNAVKYFGEMIPAYSFEVKVNDQPLASTGLTNRCYIYHFSKQP